MEHNKVSIKEVVGRVLRATRVQDSSYIPDIIRWISDASGLMRTKWALEYNFSDEQIHNYRVEFPCGLVRLMAVEYEKKRLRQKNTSRSPMVHDRPGEAVGTSMWVSGMEAYTSPNGNTAYRPTDFPVEFHPRIWYTEDGPGAILVSIQEGSVRLHYRSIPHDKDGWPLIPDVPKYLEALYWYARTKMIESGWQDPVMDWQTCNSMWEDYRNQGKNAISYPSTNRMEEVADMYTLIPPQAYFSSFNDIYP